MANLWPISGPHVETYAIVRALHGRDMAANFVKFGDMGSVWDLKTKLIVLWKTYGPICSIVMDGYSS